MFTSQFLFASEPCASVIPDLLKIINDPSARDEENLVATENAISALTKILKYNNSAINVDEVLPHWLVRMWPVEESCSCIESVISLLWF